MSTNKDTKVDPRIKRTRRMFKEALISLILENSDISKLTVQNIADRAELNRATFYLHYQDIQDLMEQMLVEILDELNETMKYPAQIKADQVMIRDQSPKNRLIAFLEHFYRNADLYHVLLENKDFRQRVFGILLEIISFWAEYKKAKNQSFKVPNEVLAASTLGIVSWWIQAGTPHSPSYLANQIILMAK